MARATYDKIRECIEDKGCKLLTLREEFAKLKTPSNTWYDIIAKCGHENKIHIIWFKYRNTGLLCKKCTQAGVVEKIKQGRPCQDIEYEGFCFLKDLLTSKFQVHKLVEGTLADFAVRPIELNDDAWLPVQLKVTMAARQKGSCYSFSLRNKYPNMIIACVCIDAKKVWLVPGNNVVEHRAINIGKVESKYNTYLSKDIVHNFEKLYRDGIKNPIQQLNTPINICQQNEQLYRRLREQKLSMFSFVYPEREGLPYDAIVNGFKIQDKVATHVKKKGKFCHRRYIVALHKRTGRSRSPCRYAIDDNDLYWIQIPNCSICYVVPQAVLIKHSIVTNDKETSKKACMLPLFMDIDQVSIKYNWLKQYRYDYDTTPIAIFQTILTTGTITVIADTTGFTTLSLQYRKQLQRDAMAKSVGKVILKMKDNTIEQQYPSINEAARCNNICSSTMQKNVKTGKTCNGYVYREKNYE
jgi:hypothetical protein